MKQDFVQEVMLHVGHLRAGVRPSWPSSFEDFVKLKQNEKPTPKFCRELCKASDDVPMQLLLNFGREIFETYKASIAYCSKYFLPFWRNPNLDSGESLTGVLNAIRDRMMESDATERAVNAAKVFPLILFYMEWR